MEEYEFDNCEGTPKAGGPSMCNWRTMCSPRKASSPLWSTLPSRRSRTSKAGQFDNFIKRKSKMTTRFFSGLLLTSVSLASSERCSRQSSCRGLFSSSLCSTTINQVIGFCRLCLWGPKYLFHAGLKVIIWSWCLYHAWSQNVYFNFLFQWTGCWKTWSRLRFKQFWSFKDILGIRIYNLYHKKYKISDMFTFT